MFKNTCLLTLLFAVLPLAAFCQITDKEAALRNHSIDSLQGWKKGGIVAISLAQTSLSNWAAGGQNSFAVNGVFSAFANYKRGKTAWDNSIDMGYGLLNQEGTKYTKKTDDKIDLLSKYGHEAFKDFYYAALLNFKSQMTTGYKYPTDSTRIKISNFMAPAYLVGALGVDYKPNAYFSIFFAPVTSKFTFVKDTALSNVGAFGVVPGENLKKEFGGYLRVIYSRNNFESEILKNVSFTTKLDLYSNFLDDPQNVDISWETLITFKINKYISVNLSSHLLYDDNILIKKDDNKNGVIEDFEAKQRIQFKEILGIGFAFKF